MNAELMHLKCPECGMYIRAPVRCTRMQGDGIQRRRQCERCGRMIVTMETVVGHYRKRER